MCEYGAVHVLYNALGVGKRVEILLYCRPTIIDYG